MSTEKQRWCFARDDDGHDYLIPVELEERFQELLEGGRWDEMNEEFDQYRSCSPRSYSFADPK